MPDRRAFPSPGAILETAGVEPFASLVAGEAVAADVRPHERGSLDEDPRVGDRVDVIAGVRWQRSPAEKAVALAPGDPGRPPDVVGNPDPAVGLIGDPPSVVVDDPGEWLLAHEIPAVFVGVDPLPGSIGLPRGIARRGRDPDAAVLLVVGPLAVGREHLLEGRCVDLGGGLRLVVSGIGVLRGGAARQDCRREKNGGERDEEGGALDG